MSRIGKKYIEIPQGVSVSIEGNVFIAKGNKGELSYQIPLGINLTIEDNKIILNREADTKPLRSLHGLARSIVANMVQGVSKPYERQLQIVGVGYRVQIKGNKLIFNVGYSHPVEYQLPDLVTAEIDDKQTTITLKSIDKHLLGQTAANIREIRPPDAYKGKGIRYSNESLKLKAGKAGKK